MCERVPVALRLSFVKDDVRFTIAHVLYHSSDTMARVDDPRAEWEVEWKARQKRWELWRAIVSIMSGELRSSSGFAVVTRRTALVG